MSYLRVLAATFASLVLGASPGWAMGAYRYVTLVAWNADSSSVLLLVSTSSSGTAGQTHTYSLISVGDAHPSRFVLDDDQEFDERKQKITVKKCAAEADRLMKALMARSFTGVRVIADACNTTDRRGLVTVDVEALQRAANAERNVMRYAIVVDGQRTILRAPDKDILAVAAQVYTPMRVLDGGKLILGLYLEGGSGKDQVMVFEAVDTTVRLLTEDATTWN